MMNDQYDLYCALTLGAVLSSQTDPDEADAAACACADYLSVHDAGSALSDQFIARRAMASAARLVPTTHTVK